jgi:hypothetical protein
VHGELVTTGHPEHWRAMRHASAAAGLDTAGARLIHNYSNVIYLLPVNDAVARTTFGHDAAEQVTRSQAITSWLRHQHQFPATQPLDNTSPVTVGSAVVSFWIYYPQPCASLAASAAPGGAPEVLGTHAEVVVAGPAGRDHPQVAPSVPAPSSQYFAGTRNMESLSNS